MAEDITQQQWEKDDNLRTFRGQEILNETIKDAREAEKQERLLQHRLSEKFLTSEGIKQYSLMDQIAQLNTEVADLYMHGQKEQAVEVIQNSEIDQGRKMILESQFYLNGESVEQVEPGDQESTPILSELQTIMAENQGKDELAVLFGAHEKLMQNPDQVDRIVESLFTFLDKRLELAEGEDNLRTVRKNADKHNRAVEANAKMAVAEGEASPLQRIFAALHDMEKYFPDGKVALAAHETSSAIMAPLVIKEALETEGYSSSEAAAISKLAAKSILLHGKGEFPELVTILSKDVIDANADVALLFGQVYWFQPNPEHAFGLNQLLENFDLSIEDLNSTESLPPDKQKRKQQVMLLLTTTNGLRANDMEIQLTGESLQKYLKDNMTFDPNADAFYAFPDAGKQMVGQFGQSTAWHTELMPHEGRAEGQIQELLKRRLFVFDLMRSISEGDSPIEQYSTQIQERAFKGAQSAAIWYEIGKSIHDKNGPAEVAAFEKFSDNFDLMKNNSYGLDAGARFHCEHELFQLHESLQQIDNIHLGETGELTDQDAETIAFWFLTPEERSHIGDDQGSEKPERTTKDVVKDAMRKRVTLDRETEPGQELSQKLDIVKKQIIDTYTQRVEASLGSIYRQEYQDEEMTMEQISDEEQKYITLWESSPRTSRGLMLYLRQEYSMRIAGIVNQLIDTQELNSPNAESIYQELVSQHVTPLTDKMKEAGIPDSRQTRVPQQGAVYI